MKLKNRIWKIVEAADDGDKASRFFDIFILSLIFLNIVVVILETVEWIYAFSPAFFRWFEIISVVIFSSEYILRLWSCTSDVRFTKPFLGRLRFIFTAMMLIDFLAIAPFYFALVGDFRAIRVLRLFRLFRIIKLARYSKALMTLSRVIKSKREELLVAVFILFMLLIISSSLMYYVENEDQPKAFSSIPDTMWWAIATLTTVGYGDLYPVTPLGKLLGSIIAILGIALFALPTGILGSGFVEELNKERKTICPHCGEEIVNEQMENKVDD